MFSTRSARRLRTFAPLLAAALLACSRSPSGGAATQPAASTAAHGSRVYVSDETGSAVVVIDPDARQVVQRISVGKRPRGIRIAPDGAHLFVALSGSPIGGPGVDESKLPPADRDADGIGVVDLASGSVIRKYQSGPDPESFAISADGRMLFVSNEDSGEMTALDLERGTITARVKVGEEPEGVTTSPDGRVVFVTCEGSGEVVAIDTAALKVIGRIATGPRPRSIAFTRDGTTGFVASENSASLTAFDTASLAVRKTIQIPHTAGNGVIPPRPMGQQLSLDGSRLFVTLGRARSIAIVDPSTQTAIGTIPDVGARPWGIGLSADGRKLYTANGPSGDVSIVDVASGTTDARIAVGGSPWGIAVRK